jgi:hypothetical protein
VSSPQRVPRTPLVVRAGHHHSLGAVERRYPTGRDPASGPAPGRPIGESPGLRGSGEPVD